MKTSDETKYLRLMPDDARRDKVFTKLAHGVNIKLTNDKHEVI